MSQTPAERAREIADQVFAGRGECPTPREWLVYQRQLRLRIERITTAALTIPANHIRTPDGKDVKVLGTLPITKDGCVVGINAYPFYVGEKADGSHVVMQPQHPPLRWLNAYEPTECYSTREAALTPTP